MTTVGYGLQDLETEWRHSGAIGLVSGEIVQVRRRNADRHELVLGDDAVSLGMLNWRNIGNQLEKRVETVPGLQVIRPQNSFQLIINRHTVSVYGLSSADPESIKWNGSGMKKAVARANSALVGDGPMQYSFFDQADADNDDTASADDDVLQPCHVCFAHWASADGTSVRIWMGFPRDNSNGGSPWLEVLELQLGEPVPNRSNERDVDTPPPTYLDGALPSVELSWRDDEGQAPGKPAAQ